MNTSKSIGKWAGKINATLKATPTATSSKFAQIKNDLVEGYREVVPAKVDEK